MLKLSDPLAISNSLQQRGVTQVRVARINDMPFSATRLQYQFAVVLYLPNDPDLVDDVGVVVTLGSGPNALCAAARIGRPFRLAINNHIAWPEFSSNNHR